MRNAITLVHSVRLQCHIVPLLFNFFDPKQQLQPEFWWGESGMFNPDTVCKEIPLNHIVIVEWLRVLSSACPLGQIY